MVFHHCLPAAADCVERASIRHLDVVHVTADRSRCGAGHLDRPARHVGNVVRVVLERLDVMRMMKRHRGALAVRCCVTEHHVTADCALAHRCVAAHLATERRVPTVHPERMQRHVMTVMIPTAPMVYGPAALQLGVLRLLRRVP
jgi:hypothetical protein